MKRISMSFCLFTVKEQTNERKKKLILVQMNMKLGSFMWWRGIFAIEAR